MVTVILRHHNLRSLSSLSNHSRGSRSSLSSLRRLHSLLGQTCSLGEIDAGGRPILPISISANIFDHLSRSNRQVPSQKHLIQSQWLLSQALRTLTMGIHQQTQTSRPVSANLPTTLKRRATCLWPLGQAPVSMIVPLPYLKP